MPMCVVDAILERLAFPAGTLCTGFPSRTTAFARPAIHLHPAAMTPSSARPLDPTSLRLFIAVCEEGHIARAAEREAIVASAVSKRLAALEAELGVSLFQRARRGIALTAAGEALLRRARELLGGMEQLRLELQEFAGGVQGSVRVLASPSVLAEHLPDDIALFLSAQPALRVQLDERISPDIVRALHDGAADLGVLWDQAELAGLATHPWRHDRLCVAMRPDHPLARRPGLSFADTQPLINIGVAPGGMMDALLRRQTALLGRTPVQRIQVSGLDAACRIVAAGLGLAILPREAAGPHADAGRLCLVPLTDDWALRRFVVAHRPGQWLPASARLLLDHLLACVPSPLQLLLPTPPAPTIAA
jgi:DNA-binding transcriptional LysR family regulator